MIPAPPSTTKKEEDKDDDHVHPWQQGGYLSDEDKFSTRKFANEYKKHKRKRKQSFRTCGKDTRLQKLFHKLVTTPPGSPHQEEVPGGGNNSFYSDSEEEDSTCDSLSESLTDSLSEEDTLTEQNQDMKSFS